MFRAIDVPWHSSDLAQEPTEIPSRHRPSPNRIHGESMPMWYGLPQESHPTEVPSQQLLWLSGMRHEEARTPKYRESDSYRRDLHKRVHRLDQSRWPARNIGLPALHLPLFSCSIRSDL